MGFDTRRIVYHCLSNLASLIAEADGGAKQTMMGSRSRIWATRILLSFPFVLIGASTCAVAVGERSIRRSSSSDFLLSLRYLALDVRDYIWLDVVRENSIYDETCPHGMPSGI